MFAACPLFCVATLAGTTLAGTTLTGTTLAGTTLAGTTLTGTTLATQYTYTWLHYFKNCLIIMYGIITATTYYYTTLHDLLYFGLVLVNKGFSLIEILVLLVIIGIVTVGITPRVIERKLGVNPVVGFYSDIVEEHLQFAEKLGRPVSFKGFLGSGNIVKMDGKRVSLPGSLTVQDAFVGGIDEPGLEYNIFVYPSGMIDYFELHLSDGTIVESIPLLATIRFQKEDGGYTGIRPAYR